MAGPFRVHTEAKAFIPSSFFLLQLLIGMSMRYYMVFGAISESIKTAELRTFFVKNKIIMTLNIIS